MKFTFVVLCITLFYRLSAQENSIGTDSIHALYKESSIIFTGVVTNNFSGNEMFDNHHIIEFDLTEIQKGKDYNKMMVYAPKGKWNIETGKEYIAFAVKKKHTTNYILLYCEEVCNKCPNDAVKNVYDIVNKTPFAGIKKPRSQKTWMDNACGCH